MIIEACVENYKEAYEAIAKKKAHRIELCENLTVGGTTPSFGTIKQCLNLNVPIFVMIRPRGGNFIYSQEEIKIMLEDINICKKLNVNGVVFGCLTKDNQIDYTITEYLINNCANMDIIFHRAFDKINESWKEVEKLAKIGVKHILSAGGETTFFEGLNNLRKILEECNKHNISLTAAGKITSTNLQECQLLLPASAFHGRNIVGKL